MIEGAAYAIQAGLRHFTPGRFFIPFIRIMYNLPRVGVRKSVIGTPVMLYKMARQGFYSIQNGKLNPHEYAKSEFVRDASEQVLAWTLVSLLWGVAAGDDDDDKKKILMTGSLRSTDAGTRDLAFRTGIPEHHIRINGTLYNYGRIEPLATVLGTTIDFIRTIKSLKNISGSAAVGNMLGSLASQLYAKTMGKGLKDIIAVSNDPTSATDWAAGFAASFVPNLIRQPIRSTDEYVRETSLETAPRDLAPRMIQRVAQGAVPLQSLNEPKIDLYGDKIKKEGNTLQRMSPLQASPAPNVHIADKLMINWNERHPDEKYAPRPPSRRYVDAATGKVKYMDDKMYRKYSEEAGKMFETLTRGSITSSMANNPKEEDKQLVSDLLNKSRKEAKKNILATTTNKPKSIMQMLLGN